jgi:site-specific recombinase XerD
MVMNTFAVSFLVRPSKANKAGESPIELSLCINTERTYINLPRKVKPSLFDCKKQVIKGRSAEATQLNEFLSLMKSKVYEAQTKLIEMDIPVTCTNMKDMMNGKIVKKQYMLLELYREHNKEFLDQVDKLVVRKPTYIKHLTAYNHLQDYIKLKCNGRADVFLSEVNSSFVNGFFTYLLTKMQNNSAIGNLKKLRKITNLALNNRYININPFVGVKYKLQEVEVEPLSERELATLMNKELTIERLQRVRDVFVFNCFTGLAYIDCKLLKQEFIVEDEQGNKWIDTKRFKTGIKCKIPLLPVAEYLLERYNYKLPVISNQKMNGYLKELADICGIKKDLHTHVARHTAATLFLNNNVDLNSVSKILGHTNIKMTQRYAKLLDTTVLKQMDVLKMKFAV